MGANNCPYSQVNTARFRVTLQNQCRDGALVSRFILKGPSIAFRSAFSPGLSSIVSSLCHEPLAQMCSHVSGREAGGLGFRRDVRLVLGRWGCCVFWGWIRLLQAL